MSALLSDTIVSMRYFLFHIFYASHSRSYLFYTCRLGGTIGDIESMPFVEALRQLQLQVKSDNFCLVHVSMVPIVGEEPGEQKTKPTQHSVKELRGRVIKITKSIMVYFMMLRLFLFLQKL